MSATCPCCGAPVTDAYVDPGCARKLSVRLVEAAGHAEDAPTVIARLTRYGGGGGGDGDRLPPDLRKSEDLAAVEGEVGTWVRVVEGEGGELMSPWRSLTGPPCPIGVSCRHATCDESRRRTPPTELAQALTWLATRCEWLRKHPAAREAFKALTTACEQLERLVDKPPTGRRLVGMCDCGQILYAPADRAVVQCKGRPRSCGATWDVERSQGILMDHLDGQLVTAAEAAHLAGFLATDRTQEQIRKLVNKWAERGQLAAHGHIWRDPTPAELDANPERGQVAMPTFRFGEIRARIAATPRRQPAGAAA